VISYPRKDGEHQARKRKERETITLSEQEEKVWVWLRRLRAVVLLADKESKHKHQQPPKYRYQWFLPKIQLSRYQNCMETRNEKHRSTPSLHTVVVTITRNGQIKMGNLGPSWVSVTLFVTIITNLLDTMWGRFQGPLRFPLDSNRLLSSPLADELLEIETPCTVSWDNNGISEAHLLLRAPPLP
jgi:hypothetical protein